MSFSNSRAPSSSGPLSHLLYTNQAPSLLEVASLHHGIASMTATISELHTELRHLKDQLSRHHAALAPIRRIPAEVLNEIFGFVLPTERTFAEKERLVNLRLVCRAWNAVSYPQWARLRVQINLNGKLPSSRIRSWFDNAGKSRKTLELRLPSPVMWNTCRCQTSDANRCWWANAELLEVLRDTKSLAGLGLEFSSPKCFQNLLAAITLHAPSTRETWGSLTTLKLAIHKIWLGNQPDQYHTLLSNLPATLRTLHLSLGNLASEQLPPQIDIPLTPFQNLTTLSVSCSWDSPFILYAIRQCAAVELLCLDFMMGFHTWTENINEVHLPRVRTLVLDTVSPSTTSKILSRLRFPRLDYLRVNNGRGSGRMLWDILDSLQLLPSSKPSTICSLKVEDMNVDSDALADILCRLPTLEHIALSHVRFDVELFINSCLDPGGSASDGSEGTQPKTLPSLKLLELRGISERFDLELLLQFFKTRKRTAKRSGSPDALRRIVLSPSNWNSRWEKRFEKCYIVTQELQRNYGVTVDRFIA